MHRSVPWSLATVGVGAALAARRRASDHALSRFEAALLAEPDGGAFATAAIDDLPEPARRYLRHAITPGTTLHAVVRLDLAGTMTPSPGARPAPLTASETLAPRRGFVWTARARMGVPVRVRDSYADGQGVAALDLLGVVPGPTARGTDVTRSARGRLVAEAVWCPTALVHPRVIWEAVGPDRARFTIVVDGEAIAVTLALGDDGALREATLDRWGAADGLPWRAVPYGFRVEAQGTVGGVTIPTRVVGGWHYGTDEFDPARAARFTVRRAAFGAVDPLTAPAALVRDPMP